MRRPKHKDPQKALSAGLNIGTKPIVRGQHEVQIQLFSCKLLCTDILHFRKSHNNGRKLMSELSIIQVNKPMVVWIRYKIISNQNTLLGQQKHTFNPKTSFLKSVSFYKIGILIKNRDPFNNANSLS